MPGTHRREARIRFLAHKITCYNDNKPVIIHKGRELFVSERMYWEARQELSQLLARK